MSQLITAPENTDSSQLSKLCVSIRGKLQFMDYLVRAAVADAERYQDENDPGTRIFIRQLVEMHAANLRLESQNMRVVGELCGALESMVDGYRVAGTGRSPMNSTRNGSHGGSAMRTAHGSNQEMEGSVGLAYRAGSSSPELRRSLAEIKGQAQFLLYLADQIEESLEQLANEADDCHGAFLCKVLGMYSGQLESKHQGLGERISETCQEVYVTVREREMS